MTRQIVSGMGERQIHLVMTEPEARHLAACLEYCLFRAVEDRWDGNDAITLRNTLGVLTDEKRGYVK